MLKRRKIRAFAVLQDDGSDGYLPVAISFRKRSLIMEMIPKLPTMVVPCVITYTPDLLPTKEKI